jgi:hypothetical protein
VSISSRIGRVFSFEALSGDQGRDAAHVFDGRDVLAGSSSFQSR